MGSESFSFSRVKNYNFVSSFVTKNCGPWFLYCSIQPHELVFTSSLYFSIVFCIQKFKLVFKLFCWWLSCDENDTESSLGRKTDVSGAFVMHFGD